LITHANQKTLELLGYPQKEIVGKPFSLFVERTDLVIFFSHWNEILGQCKEQRFEIALKHRDAKIVYVMMQYKDANSSNRNTDNIFLVFKEVTESRLAAEQMQYQQELLSLIFTLTDSIDTVSSQHLNRSIEDALKKICLFAKADIGFIYSIDRRLRRLDPAYRWCQPDYRPAGETERSKSVPLSLIKRVIVRLRKEKTWVIDDVAKVTAPERYELLAWHQADLGAFMCHLIYSQRRPIGIIGIAKHTTDALWEHDSTALVKFFGQFLAHRLPFAAIGEQRAENRRSSNAQVIPEKSTGAGAAGRFIDMGEKHPGDRERQKTGPVSDRTARASNQPALPDTTRPMLLDKLSGRQAKDQQPVFPRDDGLVLLTCPQCGLQESVSVDQFNRLGNAVSVNCPCRNLFSAVLEKRRAFRKSVQLSGYFTLKGDMGPKDTSGSIWGPMVVKNLSKAGLRFSSERADLLHSGDLLMVRFNLDNANQSLIHKPARVISTSKKEVGCRFEGADSYDITLGFYFL
jgi:hypothetical protein